MPGRRPREAAVVSASLLHRWRWAGGRLRVWRRWGLPDLGLPRSVGLVSSASGGGRPGRAEARTGGLRRSSGVQAMAWPRAAAGRGWERGRLQGVAAGVAARCGATTDCGGGDATALCWVVLLPAWCWTGLSSVSSWSPRGAVLAVRVVRLPSSCSGGPVVGLSWRGSGSELEGVSRSNMACGATLVF